jgi:hypothetical protein
MYPMWAPFALFSRLIIPRALEGNVSDYCALCEGISDQGSMKQKNIGGRSTVILVTAKATAERQNSGKKLLRFMLPQR